MKNGAIVPLIEVSFPAAGETLFEERTDEKGQKRLWFETVLQRADAVNRNNRRYPRKIMDRELKRFEQHITNGTSYGEADHPEQGKTPSLMRTAILWKTATMNEAGLVRGGGYLIDNEAGRTVAAILKAGGAVGTSSRGRGTVSLKQESAGKQVEEVNDDYQLRTFDLVVDQSVPEAESRLFRYEQHLIEQESRAMAGEQTITLESLKENHKEVYEAALKEGCPARMETILKDREAEMRQTVETEMIESGRALDEEKATRFAGLEAFGAVVIEAAKEIGLVPAGEATDEALKAEVARLKDENTKLARKVSMLEAANKELAEKAGKVEVEKAAEKFAEGHKLAGDLKTELVESCESMDEFEAKKAGIKARFDKYAAKIPDAEAPKPTGKTVLNENLNPAPGAKPEPVVSESKRRIASMAGVG